MFEYVKWCSCVEDLASERCFKVSLRTRRYSEKKPFKSLCFLGVNSTVLSTIHFLKTSPVYEWFASLKSVSPIPPPVKTGGLLGGVLR